MEPLEKRLSDYLETITGQHLDLRRDDVQLFGDQLADLGQ